MAFSILAIPRAKSGSVIAPADHSGSSAVPRPGPELAKAIIAAGCVRRGEIITKPKVTGLAAQIIAAGEKRRGEQQR